MQIIAESGGTKTDWRLLYADGKIEQFTSTGLNPTYITNTEMLDLLKNEFKMVLNEPVDKVHFYGAGCQGKFNVEKVQSVLSTFFTNCNEINVHHDLLAASRACSEDKEGIVCVLGTGSNACYYNGSEVVEQMVNLGYVLGDEGSGAQMGKKLMKDLFEGKIPDPIKNALTQQYSSLNRDFLIEQLYRKEKPNKFLAQFFPFILEHQNHPYCLQLLINCFDEFIDRLIDTFENAQQLPIHFVGGVAFHANPILRKVLQKRALNTSIIIESPIAGLTLYHQKKL